MAPPPSQRTFWIGLLAILLLAFLLRWPALYLPHTGEDEAFYLGLSLKLNHQGMTEYNLTHLDRRIEKVPVYYQVAIAENSKGNMLQNLEERGITYYSEETVSNMPPLYPYLLHVSRQIFGNLGGTAEIIRMVHANLGSKVVFQRPPDLARTQAFAVIANLTFSLLFIGLTAFLGLRMFNAAVGLLAGYLLAVSPVDLLTAQRIWADESVAFFSLLAFWLLWESIQQGIKIWLHFVAGLFVGLAILAKGSGLFILAFAGLLGIYHVTINIIAADRWSFQRTIRSTAPWLALLAGALLVSGFWFSTLYGAYGTFIYTPSQDNLSEVSSWFQMLEARNALGPAFHFVMLQPLFLSFYIQVGLSLRHRDFPIALSWLYAWPILFIILLISIEAKEARYLLPAYPAIAIVSAFALNKLWQRVSERIHNGLIGSVALVCLGIYGWFMVDLGLNTVFSRESIFYLP